MHAYIYITCNVTVRHRGAKRKLPAEAGYRAASLKQTCYLLSSSVTDVLVFVIECGIVRFLCAMRAFEVPASYSPPSLGYLCAKFRFCGNLH